MRVCGGMAPQKLNSDKTGSNTIAYCFSGRMLIYVTFSLFYFRNEVIVMNTQIIAIANQKGGVGKTTTCANLGVGLAQTGKKVLLIDGDPQGSLTISLGHPQPDKLPFTLSDAMGRILMDEPLRPGEGILHHPEGVDLMPADIQLSGMEVSLVNAMSRETILRQYLDTLKGQYSHNVAGKLSDERFALMSKTYEDEQAQLKVEIQTLQQEIEVQERQIENLEQFIQRVHKYEDLQEMTPYALRELVKGIYIEAPDKSSGKRRQGIRISYDLVGFIPVEELMKQETA